MVATEVSVQCVLLFSPQHLKWFCSCPCCSFSYTVCQDKEFHILMNGFLETSSFQMYVNDSRDEGIKQRIMLSERNAEDNTVNHNPDRVQVSLASDHQILTNRPINPSGFLKHASQDQRSTVPFFFSQ